VLGLVDGADSRSLYERNPEARVGRELEASESTRDNHGWASGLLQRTSRKNILNGLDSRGASSYTIVHV
jgi:hypothetical protein